MSKSIGPVIVKDASGQKSVRIESVPGDAQINEVVARLLSGDLPQPARDGAGRPLSYAMRSEREGRFLGSGERAEDSLMANDELVMMPSIDAG